MGAAAVRCGQAVSPLPLPERLVLFVPGQAVPQGSKTALISKSTGRPIVVDKDVRLPQWRMKVTAHALEARNARPDAADFPIRDAVGARIEFVIARPLTHFGTGRNAGRVKPGAPKHPAKMPDLDKLLRAIFDALTDAQVWADDGQVVWVQTSKHYAMPGQQVGVSIQIGVMR